MDHLLAGCIYVTRITAASKGKKQRADKCASPADRYVCLWMRTFISSILDYFNRSFSSLTGEPA